MVNPHDHRPGDPHSLHPPGVEERSYTRLAGVPFVELANVSNSYGATPALTNVSLKIWPGQFMAIVGPNGGGKTTLLRTILGMVSTTTGKVLLRGRAIKTFGTGADRLRAATGNHRLELSDHRRGSDFHGVLRQESLVRWHR